MTVIAANSKAFEKNQECKFQYMLHADKPDKWEDSPLPFPDKSVKSDSDLGGISQLPSHLLRVVKRVDKSKKKNG